MPEKITEDIKLSQQTKKIIKDLEDRIEQKYKALDILCCLKTIHECNPEDKNYQYQPDTNMEEMAQICEQLNNNQEFCAKKQSRENYSDFDTLHEIKARLGTATTLFFINSQLVINMEKFFSGLLLSYMTIFDKNSKRLPVDSNLIFTKEEKEYHDSIHRLRDKWYAHTENRNGRHQLTYLVSENKIKFNENGIHKQPEYYVKSYKTLYLCTNKLYQYLTKDISERTYKLEQNLPKEDAAKLIEHYKERKIKE